MESIWEQIVNKKDEWIGGLLETINMPKGSETPANTVTVIRDIELKEFGDQLFFKVLGEQFACGLQPGRGGGVIAGEDGWLTFCGVRGHRWRIKKKLEIPSGESMEEMRDKAVQEAGFKDFTEFMKMVSGVDLTDPQRLAAFENWKKGDMKKSDLEAISKIGKQHRRTK
ncbi:MAG: hypothetical protein BV459_06690 [Thermoplasmata archaeon M11B2D]|nr:MAG: hypothetical protein BV459_06690 [Thermoplasmata archaeon M11B2D]PNX51204.1 MAG: hypothetical protein BV458_11860 [Thermoplasmata archaeon M9B2D]